MKLTLNGSPEELSKILGLIAISELTNKVDTQLGLLKKIDETVKENSVPAFADKVFNPVFPAAQEPTETKRTRRTKAEMEAANNAPAAVETKPTDNTVSLDELNEFAQEKAQAGHTPAIKARLAELGAKKTKELDPKHYNAFYVFLQGL